MSRNVVCETCAKRHREARCEETCLGILAGSCAECGAAINGFGNAPIGSLRGSLFKCDTHHLPVELKVTHHGLGVSRG
jgi:hypothetical protein